MHGFEPRTVAEFDLIVRATGRVTSLGFLPLKLEFISLQLIFYSKKKRVLDYRRRHYFLEYYLWDMIPLLI
jgi:hypothetical protein